jgi:hypothetical protein
MKLTQKQIKRIIREELEEMMGAPKRSRVPNLKQLQDFVNKIMADDIGIVGYPGSPDVRQRVEHYANQAGIHFTGFYTIEDLKNSLIMNATDSNKFDPVAGFLEKTELR